MFRCSFFLLAALLDSARFSSEIYIYIVPSTIERYYSAKKYYRSFGYVWGSPGNIHDVKGHRA